MADIDSLRFNYGGRGARDTMKLDMQDKRLGMLMLLVKLNVLGVRKVRYSIASTLISRAHAPNFSPPPCSIPLAVTGLSLDFLQFVPKAKYPDEDWVVI